MPHGKESAAKDLRQAKNRSPSKKNNPKSPQIPSLKIRLGGPKSKTIQLQSNSSLDLPVTVFASHHDHLLNRTIHENSQACVECNYLSMLSGVQDIGPEQTSKCHCLAARTGNPNFGDQPGHHVTYAFLRRIDVWKRTSGNYIHTCTCIWTNSINCELCMSHVSIQP